MLEITTWALAVWARWTMALTVGVALVWWLLPTDSGWLPAVAVAALGIEYYICRQLCREWLHQAQFSWWWAR